MPDDKTKRLAEDIAGLTRAEAEELEQQLRVLLGGDDAAGGAVTNPAAPKPSPLSAAQEPPNA